MMRAAIAALAMIAAPVSAQAPARAIDVRGVALGMSPAQAQAAIATAGLPAVERGPLPNGVGFGMDRVRPNNQEDLIFVSSMATSPPSRPGPQSAHELLAVAFTPEAGKERVWAVGMTRSYGPGEMPSVTNTLQALAAKYGDTSWMSPMNQASFMPGVPRDRGVHAARLLWYWDGAGRQGGPAQYETCRYGLHQAYITNQVNTMTMRAFNAAFEKPHWFDNALRAGCTRVIRAQLQWNRDGAVTALLIEAADLEQGVAAGRRLASVIAARAAQASRARSAEAAGNKPVF